MRIGDRQSFLTFQAPSGSPIAWTTIFTEKGYLKNLSAQESIAALAVGSTIVGTILIPWRPVDIKTTWRILLNGSVLNIASVIDVLMPQGRFFSIKVKRAA